jgi:N-acetylmuramic acid 6-phosphate (MurNAc-6-P) etherase
MTNIAPMNEKLRARAVRIVVQLAGVDPERARELLDQNGDSVAAAVQAAHAPVQPERC